MPRNRSKTTVTRRNTRSRKLRNEPLAGCKRSEIYFQIRALWLQPICPTPLTSSATVLASQYVISQLRRSHFMALKLMLHLEYVRRDPLKLG